MICGGVLSTSNAMLSSSPASAVEDGFDGESEATILMKYVPFGTVAVSQTRIESEIFRRSAFQPTSPSRRYHTSYDNSSSFSSSARQTIVCKPFWYVFRPREEPAPCELCAA